MGKNKRLSKKGGIKIVDPRRIDYTCTGDNSMFDMNSPLHDGKDNGPKTSRIEKDLQRLRYDSTKNTKTKTKGRITAGQSKQSHSSVYE